MNIESKEIVLCIDGQEITGKNAVITSVDISIDNGKEPAYFCGSRIPVSIQQREPRMDITFEMSCTDFSFNLFTDDYKPKISTKKVKDCSIQELLFAVREKVRLGESHG